MISRLAAVFAITLMSLAACAEQQPWPMGLWKGEGTLAHVATGAVTTSPVTATMYYPGYMGDGVDDPRFILSVSLVDREIHGGHAPFTREGTTASAVIDGGTYKAVAKMSSSGRDKMLMEFSWRTMNLDGGFVGFVETDPVEYTERISLERTGDFQFPKH